MDLNVRKYRLIYKKCKWCQYYKYNSPSLFGIECSDYEECTLKDKIIHFTSHRCFCKWYKLKEGKI